jgi:subtilisin family serine protease
MKKLKYSFVLFFLLSLKSLAQNGGKYWIFFKERELQKSVNVSKDAQINRALLGKPIWQASDFGPRSQDIIAIKSNGINPLKTSKWLNAISATLNSEQIEFLKDQSYVSGLKKITSETVLQSLPQEINLLMTFSLAQLKADLLVKENLNGKNVKIGVVDAGFYNAHQETELASLFLNNQIKVSREFVELDKKDFFGEKISDLEVHGTMVLKAIGGLDTLKNAYYGLATQSNYYLARTESSKKESREEEDNWIAAVEWMDSLGVRLVNSSLGYSQGFTDPSENYLPKDMDGFSSVISKGAKIAAEEKGMILVVSAGNEGENRQWKGLLSAPADVEAVISVGANDRNGLKMSYSSVGPEDLAYVKPDISSYSYNGTSFAAPIITGLVACMLQIQPNLDVFTIKSILKESGILFPNPNNYVGYGFPDAGMILSKMNNIQTTKKFEKINGKDEIKILEFSRTSVLVFHKSDSKTVISQEIKNTGVNGFSQSKPKGAKFTTLHADGRTIEIEWDWKE